MAFSDLKPVSANDERSYRTFILGSVFAVYGSGTDVPLVYSWDMVKSVSATGKTITVEVPGHSYVLNSKMFDTMDDMLRGIAIIECRQKEYGFRYDHGKRMLPLKSQYTECSPGRETYTGEGMLDEADTAAAFIMMLNFRLVKFLWLISLLISLITLGVLQLTVGITRENILYFIPISLAAGGIAALLVNIVSHAVARGRFKSFADADPAAREPLTFVVSKAGFAVCESCIYEGRDLVPWSEMDYFVESDKMFIFYKNNSPATYIPKKAFPKKYVGGIADIIALSLEQR